MEVAMSLIYALGQSWALYGTRNSATEPVGISRFRYLVQIGTTLTKSVPRRGTQKKPKVTQHVLKEIIPLVGMIVHNSFRQKERLRVSKIAPEAGAQGGPLGTTFAPEVSQGERKRSQM